VSSASVCKIVGKARGKISCSPKDNHVSYDEQLMTVVLRTISFTHITACDSVYWLSNFNERMPIALVSGSSKNNSRKVVMFDILGNGVIASIDESSNLLDRFGSVLGSLSESKFLVKS
jgi:hypothetical protein